MVVGGWGSLPMLLVDNDLFKSEGVDSSGHLSNKSLEYIVPTAWQGDMDDYSLRVTCAMGNPKGKIVRDIEQRLTLLSTMEPSY